MTKITNKNNKGISHVQKGLKADAANGHKRPIKEFAELCSLIRDQFDDDHGSTIKRNGKTQDVLDQKDTISKETL